MESETNDTDISNLGNVENQSYHLYYFSSNNCTLPYLFDWSLKTRQKEGEWNKGWHRFAYDFLHLKHYGNVQNRLRNASNDGHLSLNNNSRCPSKTSRERMKGNNLTKWQLKYNWSSLHWLENSIWFIYFNLYSIEMPSATTVVIAIESTNQANSIAQE